MSFYNELKRRNVFRVGLAYGITTWLIAQIAGLAAASFFAPDWVMKMIITVLVLGFPVAMVMAWAYELTPDGLRRESDIEPGQSTAHVTASKLDRTITIALVVAVAYFTYDKFVLVPKRDAAMLESAAQQIADAAPEAVLAEGEQVRQQSIAVLPFVNMSSDPEQEYFSDGLSEEILNLLTKIPGLKVIGRTSSFVFKGKNEDLRVIGQTLGVTTVLEGSVRKSGEQVRITAQLVDVSDGTHIWSETYERTMTDIFAVQDDVAAAIIDTLQIHVGANPTRGRPTENTEAYALFLKARVSLNSYELRDAEELLLKAIELDPKFAEANELLAYTYWNVVGGFEPVEAQRRTGKVAARAIAIDPDLVFAQALLESAKVENYSYLREIEAFERTAREQPSNPTVLQALSFYLLEAGYLREAVGIAERFVELEPLSSHANIRLFQALYAVGRTSEAIAALEIADHLGSDYVNSYLGIVNLVERRNDIAIAYFEAGLEQEGFPDLSWVRELVTGARDPATGQAYLDRHIPEIIASMPEEEAHDWQWRLTLWYQMFGFLDRHFEIILATDPADSTWGRARSHVWKGTIFRRLGFTAHPKYLEVVKLMGIVDLWEQRGPPDFCEKVGGQWICE